MLSPTSLSFALITLLLWAPCGTLASIRDKVVDCGTESCLAYDVTSYNHIHSFTCRMSMTTSGVGDIAIFDFALCPVALNDVLAAQTGFCFGPAPSPFSNPTCAGSISEENLSTAQFGRPPCEAAASGCKHKFHLEVPFLALGDYGFQFAEINGTNNLVATNEAHLCVFSQAPESLADWEVQCLQSFFIVFKFNVQRAVVEFNQWRISSRAYPISMDQWVGEAKISDVTRQAETWPARLRGCVYDAEKSTIVAAVQRVAPFDNAAVHHFSLSGVAPDPVLSGEVWMRCTQSFYDSGNERYVPGPDVLFVFPVSMTMTALAAVTSLLWSFHLTSSSGQPAHPFALVGSQRITQRLTATGESASLAVCELRSIEYTHADRGGGRVTRTAYSAPDITAWGIEIGFRFESPLDNACNFTFSAGPGTFRFYGGEIGCVADVVVQPKDKKLRSTVRSGEKDTQQVLVATRIRADGDIFTSAGPKPSPVDTTDTISSTKDTPMFYIVAIVACSVVAVVSTTGFVLLARRRCSPLRQQEQPVQGERAEPATAPLEDKVQDTSVATPPPIAEEAGGATLDDGHADDAHVDDAHVDDAHVDDAHVDDAHVDNERVDNEQVDNERVDNEQVDEQADDAGVQVDDGQVEVAVHLKRQVPELEVEMPAPILQLWA